MADRYTSRIALVLDEPVHVGDVVAAAIQAGDIDRTRAVRDPAEAAEVNWGGRMAKAVVRRLVTAGGAPVAAVTGSDGADASGPAPTEGTGSAPTEGTGSAPTEGTGADLVDLDEASTGGTHLLRVEAYVGADGMVHGLQRQAQLLQGLARQLRGQVQGVRDLSARRDHDVAWMNRLAIGAVRQDDVVDVHTAGEGTHWLATHGAARLDVPDLELYGLRHDQVDAARAALAHVHAMLLDAGLKQADLSLPSGTPVHLVPVLEAWRSLPLEWPGVGRAGMSRGPGLDGPRATLSILRKPRFGRYRTDVEGVLEEW